MDRKIRILFRGAIYLKMAFLLCMMVTFGSCRPDPLEVTDIPIVKPEIVVANQMIPGGSLVVLLTKTFGALQAGSDSDPADLLNQIAINDALVTITGPDGVHELEFIGNGLYGGINIPFKEGEEYQLYVQSSSMGTVEATTRVQSEVKFNEVSADLYYNDSGESFAQITYSIRDQEGPNYYMLNVQEVELKDLLENAINPRAYTKIFVDESFDGGVFSEQFRVFPRNYEAGDTIAVSLANLNKDYYQFLEMRLDNRSSFLEFISEPVNYPSNVVGGRGFFNLHIPDFRFFVLGED